MVGSSFDDDCAVATPATLARLPRSIADLPRGDEVVVTWQGIRTLEVTKRLPQFRDRRRRRRGVGGGAPCRRHPA
ncbi:MAG: hypothetical protein WCA29_09520 [Jiangellales bacterium]